MHVHSPRCISVDFRLHYSVIKPIQRVLPSLPYEPALTFYYWVAVLLIGAYAVSLVWGLTNGAEIPCRRSEPSN